MAQDAGDNYAPFHIHLDKETIAKGYTVSAFDDSLKLSLVPGILSEDTAVDEEEIPDMDSPWQLERISKIFQFEFRNKAAYDNSRPFYIQFKYDKASTGLKQVFFYDKNFDAWRPLPTEDFPAGSFVRSLIHLPYARIAVFTYPDILASGDASWYRYKKGDFAASPDFPMGSRLRVFNLADGKFVDVTINDHGPDRNRYPKRVVDLTEEAFEKISPLGAGVTSVRIQPLYIAPESGEVLGIPPQGASASMKIVSKAAILMRESDGQVFYQKNATSSLPLASLTKLVAMKVFLDTRPSLDKVVAYKVQDENYNYQYVDNKWEVARLKVEDGDTLTVGDLLYSALVGSANNAVESLVRVSGLSRDEFIKKMNEAVAGWGCASTHFEEPTGLSPQNVSSALDYAIITKEVFKDPIIQKASTMPQYRFTTINTKKAHFLRNTNQLIRQDDFQIVGSKTGYLDEAGYCLMTRIKTPSGNLISVILGDPTRSGSFSETEDLLRYGEYQIKKL